MTPNFDQLITQILSDLKPHQRSCRQCGLVFDIFKEDIEFYKKFKVPPPTLCSSCRLQRRLGYRINFLPIFYKKTCSVPGHQEKIITFYSEVNPVKVYDDQYHNSDQWEALEFGRDYIFDETFFEQFNQLALAVPHQSLQKDPTSVNCDYVVSGVSSKNCYYVAIPVNSENISYGYLPFSSRDCVDVNLALNCEQCYESVNVENCYNCYWCFDSLNCVDSRFLYDCRNCTSCFGCSNLRNKNYCFFNQQLSKEDYQKKLAEINLGQRSIREKYYRQFEDEILSQAIRKNLNNIKSVDCLGDEIKNSRNCFSCFALFRDGGENLRYVTNITGVTDSMDFYGGMSNSLLYESTFVAFASQIKFSLSIRTGSELEYCLECNNCQYCFGCVGLKNKSYCLFNKQYSQAEYWLLLDQIKTKMLKEGEYGEFFPLTMSPVNYKDSSVFIEFPLTDQEIIKQGWHFEPEIKSDHDLSQFQVLRNEEVPDDIANVSDRILNSVIICNQTGKPFKITKFELDFYRQKNLPLPIIHPLQRIKNRFAFRRPYRLWQYPCSKCGQTMSTSYDPKKKLKVYCESCYLAEVV
ncbi:MAG: hypothetical protein HY219_00850 [Candidatus Staskawiczbacteria bacterium]|nr:hypothetical protein [Candidatus Staskawiczbacteria bacterium]